MVQALETRRSPLITGAEAMKSVVLSDAIYRSAKQDGAWIRL